MAVRLNVIMVTPPASVAGQSLAESTIGSVIGVPGIDLALVGRIEQMDPGSTDYLTLESMSSDVAVLDWGPQGQTVERLGKIGFHGIRARHTGDPDAPDVAGQSGRRIYAFDLSKFDSGASVCQALTNLLNTRRTKTFSLGPSPTPVLNKRSTVAPIAPKPPITKPEPTPAQSPLQHSESDLDRLVDELDSLDP